VLEEYFHYMKRSRYSQDTIDTYRSILSNFVSWLTSRGKSLDNFSPNDVQECMRTRYSARSSNTFLAAIKAYMRYRVGSLPLGDPRATIESQRESQIRLLRSSKTPTRVRKTALTVDELRDFMKRLGKDKNGGDMVKSGAVLTFYFGARPSELALYLKRAKIDWKNHEMIIATAKRGGSERYLVWHDSIDPYLKMWFNNVNKIGYPREWLTKRMKRYSIGGLPVTSRVARKTFQTNMRNRGIDDFYIDHVLGHVSRSPIADVYTDYSDPKFKEKIREIMCEKHYMITEGIV